MCVGCEIRNIGVDSGLSGCLSVGVFWHAWVCVGGYSVKCRTIYTVVHGGIGCASETAPTVLPLLKSPSTTSNTSNDEKHPQTSTLTRLISLQKRKQCEVEVAHQLQILYYSWQRVCPERAPD